MSNGIQNAENSESKKINNKLQRLNKKLVENTKEIESLTILYDSIDKSHIKARHIGRLLQHLFGKSIKINNKIESTTILERYTKPDCKINKLNTILPTAFEKNDIVEEISEVNLRYVPQEIQWQPLLSNRLKSAQRMELRKNPNHNNFTPFDSSSKLSENNIEPRVFYVCSYGGCGSWMLCRYLENFGRVFHLHSRCPPKKLCYTNQEWFNSEEIEKIGNYTIIYIYKNPIYSIFSRFINNNDIMSSNLHHLNNIQCQNNNATLKQVLECKKDLYKIESFYDNYTKTDTERNYKIHCVKYEDFWSNINLFNETIQIPENPELYPQKNETDREINISYIEILNDIYSPLIRKMNEMQFIEIR